MTPEATSVVHPAAPSALATRPVPLDPPPPFRATETEPRPTAGPRKAIAWPLVRFLCFIALLAGTSAAYAVAVGRFNKSSHDSSGDADGGGDDGSAEPIFLHACFAMAILLEAFGAWRTLRTLVRTRLYRRRAINEWLTPEEITVAEGGLATPTREGIDAPTTPRMLRALFGAPPKKAPVSVLPTYESALTQSARQAARREV